MPFLRTCSATSSKTLPPCIIITLDAISSALYACASFCTANALNRCIRMADMATLRPPPPLYPSGLRPRDWAVAQGLLFTEPLLMDPSSAADKPDAARTDNSAASSMRRRIEVTDRNTPGSMGGGAAFPGLGRGKEENGLPGDSGGEYGPRSRCLLVEMLIVGAGSGGRRASGADKVAGSRFSIRRDSSSSRGSWSHGPWG